MSYFPIKIRLQDGTEQIIEYGHHVPKGVPFTVLETDLPVEEEKVEITSGYAFELMDRTHCAMSSFEDLIHTHPMIEQFPELNLFANVVLEYLMKIYQVSAGLCFEWDEEPNKDKTFEEMLASADTIQMLKQQDECTAHAPLLSLLEAEKLAEILNSEVAERSCRPEVVKLRDRVERYTKVMKSEYI